VADERDAPPPLTLSTPPVHHDGAGDGVQEPARPDRAALDEIERSLDDVAASLTRMG